MRIAQAVNLLWRDVRLEGSAGPYVVLLIADVMATWGKHEGPVFPPVNERWTRGESTREAFRVAWERASIPTSMGGAGIDRAKWDVSEGDDEVRGH